MTRVLAFALVLFAAPVHAQLPDPPAAPTEDAVAEARRHFVTGMARAQEERWDEALDAFLASYARSGSPVALFNVGSALRELRRPREARDALDRLLADPELDPAMRERAEPLRMDVAAQVARVSVDGVPSGAARVLADGAEREITDARPIRIDLDPGERTLAIELASSRWDWAGRLEPGARIALTARFDELARPSDPLPWVLLGVGLAAAAAVIVAIAVAEADAQLAPRTPFVIVLP